MFTKRGVFLQAHWQRLPTFLVQLCTHTLVCKARRMDDFLKKEKISEVRQIELNTMAQVRQLQGRVG